MLNAISLKTFYTGSLWMCYLLFLNIDKALFNLPGAYL